MTDLKVTAPEVRGPIGLTHPSLAHPTLIPFDSLNVSVERFQVRSPESCTYVSMVLKKKESVQQSAELVKLLATGTKLDPIVVWKDASDKHWVVDGHHRMEALTESRCPADRKIWVQLFKGASEAEARGFALQINRRSHINMHPSEVLESYWRMLLCGETKGSVRGRVASYNVSQSTVQRMDKEKKAVIERLQKAAIDEKVVVDAAYIRTNAPLWKELATWRDGQPVVDVSAMDRKAVEAILRKLTIHLTDQAKAQPEVLLEAFREFFEEATGMAIEIQRGADDSQSDPDSDF